MTVTMAWHFMLSLHLCFSPGFLSLQLSLVCCLGFSLRAGQQKLLLLCKATDFAEQKSDQHPVLEAIWAQSCCINRWKQLRCGALITTAAAVFQYPDREAFSLFAFLGCRALPFPCSTQDHVISKPNPADDTTNMEFRWQGCYSWPSVLFFVRTVLRKLVALWSVKLQTGVNKQTWFHTTLRL